MVYNSLGCQVCLSKFNSVSYFKKHVRSEEHQKKMKEVFQKAIHKGPGFFPSISIMDPLAQYDIKQPIVGVSLLTLCFSQEAQTFFYLCHVCEDKCPPDKILVHLSSGDHASKYFNYTDPNVLSFSWMPSMDMRVILRPQLIKEADERGPGTLQMLDLPANLMKKLGTSTYSQVMSTLNENDKLFKVLQAAKPKRTMIQTYQRDDNRKHPLLGMQHIIECICVGPVEKRCYLCTLCNLTLGTRMIIKHVLSFDHIFSYFKAWHPSTLMSKESYNNYNRSFASMMLDFAKQTEEIHGTANTEMKQVTLQPAEYTSVNFTCYAEALKKLETITKENGGSSLITSIKPGNMLKYRTVSASSVAPSYKLRCQDCSIVFPTILEYLKHLSQWKHKQMLKKIFREAERADGYGKTDGILCERFYKYCQERLKQNKPAIGISLVVVCVSTECQAEPIYVCFACEDCFPESFLTQHFESQKHLIQTLLYQNPWRLPFAWENDLDVKVLRSKVWEEEKERGPNQMMLKVLDIPCQIFQSLIPPSYPKVMERLELHHTYLKQEVPQCETYSKLQQNERFPLLGKQFMVMHDVCIRRHQSTELGFLCLLCERRLVDGECYAHVFSRQHVAKFLDCFHPGSLSSSTDTETLLDLAKQAARFHPISHVQVIQLEKPIWEPCSYHRAQSIVASAKRRHGRGALEPPITPSKTLVPRRTQKEVANYCVRDNSEKNSKMMGRSENQTSEKSTDNNGSTPKKISAEPGSEIISKGCVESEENAGKGSHKETPSDKESQKRREMLSKTSPDEKKNASRETYQSIKEEKAEEATIRTPSGKIPESCQNADRDSGAETGKKSSKSSKNVLTQMKGYIHKENERKRPNSLSEKSQEHTCPDGDLGREMGQKRQRLTSKEDTSCEEPQKMPSGGLKEENGRPSHKTAQDKASSNENHQQVMQLLQYVKMSNREPVVGLSKLLECHCDQRDPIYLCECCSQTIPEKNIISHMTGFDHQKMYLMGLQKVLPAPGRHQRKKIRELAALLEQDKGYGEAQAVDLHEEIYNNLSKQNFNSAIQTVKALLAQQDSGHEVLSASAMSGVQPVHTSVTVHAQHEVCSITDNIQVVEIDHDSEDCEAQPSSVAAITISKRNEVPPESKADIKKTQIKIPDSADTSLTVSTSSEAVPKLTSATSDCTTGTTKMREAAYKCVAATSSATASTSKLSAANPKSITTAISTAPTSITKSTASATICMATISKCTAASAKLTGATSTASVTISNTPSTMAFAKGSKPQEDRTRAASKGTATSCKAAPTSQMGPRFVREAGHRTPETASKLKVSCQTGVTIAATATMAKTWVECEYTEPSAKTAEHMKKSVGGNAESAPHIHKGNPPAAPHLTTATSVRSEHKNPPTQPSHTPTTKKPIAQPPKVGLNHLIAVSCEGRQQVYCQLCSVRLKRSSHVLGTTHQYNYVKTKYPGWNVKLSELESKLNKIVAHLAEVEKDLGPQSIQRMEVMNDVYTDLAALPEDKAVERLKAMVRERDLEVPSSSTTDTAEALKEEVAFASPCEISSPDDGMYMPQNEMPELSTNNQPEQENRHELHMLLVQKPEMKSNLKEVPDQSDRTQSWTDKDPEANDQIPDQLESCLSLKNDREPIPAPRIQDADVIEISPLSHPYLPAAKEEKPCDCAHPLATDSESAGTFAQTTYTRQETPENRQQQERSDPEIRDTEETLPVVSASPDLLSSAASVNTEQQNQSRPRLTAEHAPKHPGCSPGPGQQNKSRALPSISIAEKTQGCSNLSAYLRVMGLDTEPVIGMGSVWECRGLELRQSFFLCESCSVMLSNNDICQHMISTHHQIQYMRKYPKFLEFLSDKDLLPQMKLDILKGVACKVSQQERFKKMDAQCVLLGHELYECVRKASISEALEMVQSIKKKQKLSALCLPVSPPQQRDKQPERWQSQEGSLPMGALETDQRADNGAREKTGKHHLEEKTVISKDEDDVRRRTVSSPPNVTNISSKTDPVVSPFPGPGPCLSPQETDRSPFMPPELRPPVSQHQRPIPELQVKQAEVHSESQLFCTVSPETIQTMSVSPRDKYPATRKRPADTSVETLVRPHTSNPQLEDPLPAKCTRSSLQQHCQLSAEPPNKSTSVNPAATSTLLSQKDGGMRPGSDEPDKPIVDLTRLIALVRDRKSQKNVHKPETASCCANNSSESGVERKSDSEFVLKLANDKTRWNSEGQLGKDTVKTNLPSTTSSKDVFSATPFVVAGCENQQVAPNPNSFFFANNAPPEGYSTRGNPLYRATEAKAISTMLPSPSTADPSVSAQKIFGNVNQRKSNLIYCAPTSHNTTQISQPQGKTETDTTSVFQLPINPSVSTRSDPTNQQFMGSYKLQDHTEVNRGIQVTHSFFPVETPNSGHILAGGYDQYSRVATSPVSSEAVLGYTTPDNPPIYTLSLHKGYTAGMFYPNQIYPERDAIQVSLQSYGHSLATPRPPGSVSLKIQLQQQQQPQPQPQPPSSWTNASLAAGDGIEMATRDAASLGTNPFASPAYNSQR
ncbi:uncharacterized protein LOC121192035 isoform X2 [Toxotes jaculatrix]|uniref:uncharacterized protein LOC121192035 isoform X2 n=1 Tax=Toxotes jaculatrix TaxID=941984 RepID=UPI001B3AB2DB|nr:uncharacterized protein LOC121192035 isoform X2 [Toxotes jaculatrix]